MNKIIPVLSFVAIAVLQVAGSSAQTVKLVLNKGSKYEATTVSISTSVSQMMGQDVESKFENTTVQTIEVKESSDKATDLVSTVSKITANTTMMGQEMNYDSDKKDNEGPLAEGFGKLVGKPRNITIDPGGKVISEDKSVDSAMGSMGMMMTNNMASIIPMIQAALVGKQLTLGSTWPDSLITNNDKLKVSIIGTYLVKQIDKNIATIGFTGLQSMTGTIEQMGQELGMKADSKISNLIQLDMNTGLVIENEYNINGTGNIDAMGMSIPITIISKVNNKIRTF